MRCAEIAPPSAWTIGLPRRRQGCPRNRWEAVGQREVRPATTEPTSMKRSDVVDSLFCYSSTDWSHWSIWNGLTVTSNSRGSRWRMLASRSLVLATTWRWEKERVRWYQHHGTNITLIRIVFCRTSVQFCWDETMLGPIATVDSWQHYLIN